MGFGMIKSLAVKNFEFIFKRSLRKNYQLNICQFKRKVSRADLVLTDMRNPTIIEVQADVPTTLFLTLVERNENDNFEKRGTKTKRRKNERKIVFSFNLKFH